jgi:hypothetical protein
MSPLRKRLLDGILHVPLPLRQGAGDCTLPHEPNSKREH